MRTQRRRLAGLGTDVSLDRQRNPGACLLLHVRISLLQYLHKQAEAVWPGLSMEELIEQLRQIQQFQLLYPPQGKKGPPRAATILSKQTLPQQSPAQAARPAHRQLALVGNTTVPRATPTRSILYSCSRPSPSKVPLAFTSRSINPVVRILGSDLTIFAKGRHSRTGGLFGLGHGSASDPGRGSCDRLRPGSGTCLPETLLKAWCSTSPGISSRIIWMLPMASWV